MRRKYYYYILGDLCLCVQVSRADLNRLKTVSTHGLYGRELAWLSPERLDEARKYDQ